MCGTGSCTVEVKKHGELVVSLVSNIQDILDLFRFSGTVLAGMGRWGGGISVERGAFSGQDSFKF